ncbi:GNAT family N-acetyltransferase [Jatrophihabitans sp. DSM 45814]
MVNDAIKIVENTGDTRFEIYVDGELAGFTVYQVRTPELYAFVHTEIGAEFAHRGLASELIEYALESMRTRAISVLPYCAFVRAFIAQHDDFLELVPMQSRVQFELPDLS